MGSRPRPYDHDETLLEYIGRTRMPLLVLCAVIVFVIVLFISRGLNA